MRLFSWLRIHSISPRIGACFAGMVSCLFGVLNAKSWGTIFLLGVLNAKSWNTAIFTGVLNAKNWDTAIFTGVLNAKS
jgi:hypothetical protein